jgi:hypothetical protein
MNHLLRVRPPRALVLCLGLLAAVLVPSAARADIAINSFQAGPVAPYIHPTGLPVTSTPSFDTGCLYGTPGAPISTAAADAPLALTTQAGASTDFCVKFRLAQEDAAVGQDLKNTLVELPVGTYAEIDKAAKCTPEQFARESTGLTSCPGNSQIGTALAQLQVATGAMTRVVQDAPGRIFALSTPSDKAALLGVALVGSSPPGTAETKFLITVTQEGTPTTGLLNLTDDLNRVLAQSSNAPIAVWANALRFWGKASEHTHLNSFYNPALGSTTPAANFFRVGTTCATPQVTKLTVTPYSGTNPVTTAPYTGTTNPTTASSPAYNLTGCENLPFTPTFTAAISGETQPGGHPQLDVKITSPSDNEDLGGTKITLPSGIATDLSRIQNACPQATFQANACPESANIGTVKATLTGIDDGVVSGDVQMVKVEGKQLPALGLNFKGRLALRVFGVSEVDSSGRLVSTFSNLPSLPQRSLDITLFGGSKGILQTDPTGKCTDSAYDATLTGQNGKVKTFSLATTCAEQFSAKLSNSTKTRPVLWLGSAAPTGKKVKTLRVGLPKGLKWYGPTLRKAAKVTFAGFDTGVDGETSKAVKLGSKAKFTFPGTGSRSFSVLTHTGALRATSSFAKSTKTVYVEFRVVYSDGSKVTKYVAIQRG